MLLGRPDEPIDASQDSPPRQKESENEKCGSLNAYFMSTQMQLRHETLEEQEQEDARVASTISRLQSFSNDQEASRSPRESSRHEKSTKKLMSKGKVHLKKAKPKAKSMNNFVRETFNRSELSYFSGNQKKIDHFVKSLQKDKDVCDLDSACNANLFNKNEWSTLVKRLKEKFPNLLRSGKHTLKAINRRVQDHEVEKSKSNSPMWASTSFHPEGALSSEDAKWLYDLDDYQMANTSSFSDNGADDTSNTFVVTLSQTAAVTASQNPHASQSVPNLFQEHITPNEGIAYSRSILCDGTDNKHEISDQAALKKYGGEFSSGESCEGSRKSTYHQRDDEILRRSLLLFEPNTQIYDTRLQAGKILEPTIEVISDSDPEADSIIIIDSPSCSDEVVTSHQPSITPFEVISSDSLFIPETPVTRRDSLELNVHSPDDAIESIRWLTEEYRHPTAKPSVFTPQTPTRNTATFTNDDIIITSVEKPKRRASDAFEMPRLDGEDVFFTAPDNHQPLASLNGEPDILKVENGEREQEEARHRLSPPIPTGQRIAKRQRVLHTSMFETKNMGESDFYVNNDLGIVMCKVGTRLDPIDLDNEVPDSDAESGDGIISIYEITREIDPEHEPEAGIAMQAIDNPVPRLQVPSSPLVAVDGILDMLPASSSPRHSPISPISSSAIELEAEPECLSQFSELTTDRIKKTLLEWGLKPLKGREKMLQALENTQKLIQGSQPGSLIENIPNTREVIFEAITKIIKLDWGWHEKIVSFEPLRIADLQLWLGDQGHKLELSLLEQYCDELGICCTNQG